MKRVGIGVGIAGLLILATACSDDAVTPGGGSSGSAGTPATGGGGAGGAAAGASPGGAAGTNNTAGSGTAGGGSGGMAGGSGGATGGSGGAAGSGGSGGSGGAATCKTALGKAIKFVGGNTVDSVAGDLGTDGPQGDDARTLELWAKFTSATSWEQEHTILERGVPPAQDNHNNVFGIDLSGRVDDNNGAFGPYVHGWSDNNGKDVKFAAPANAGWLHLSWAYDPTKEPNKRLEFTVNGDPIAVQFTQSEYDKTGGKLVLNKGYVLLGASQQFGPGGWDGVMDEVRIWKAYRTPQQIKDNMRVIVKPDAAGLVAYYQFDEADAANIADSTKKASHKLASCTQAGGACSNANGNGVVPTFVDSDIMGTFTCGQ